MENGVSFACPQCGAVVRIPEMLVRGAGAPLCPACGTEMEIELRPQAGRRPVRGKARGKP